MNLTSLVALACCAGMVASLAHAQTARPGIQLSLESVGQSEINAVDYRCGGETAFTVSYVNADPSFLAIVEVEGKPVVFASVLSASGARYVAGKYEWWTKGSQAFLRDITLGSDAPPVLECSEER